MWKKNMGRQEAADIIGRFMDDRSWYPQEWNDFVDSAQEDTVVESCRRQCAKLDPLVNRPGPPDPEALTRLKEIMEHLRAD